MKRFTPEIFFFFLMCEIPLEVYGCLKHLKALV